MLLTGGVGICQLQWKAALMSITIREMSAFTVSTDSIVSLAPGRLLTSIWKPTVSRAPVLLLPGPPSLGRVPLGSSGQPELLKQSGTIENPDGRRATQEESPPFITIVISGAPTEAYAIREPAMSLHDSCKMSMLFWFTLAEAVFRYRDIWLAVSWPLEMWIICCKVPLDKTSHWFLVSSLLRKSNKCCREIGSQMVFVALKTTPGGSPGSPMLLRMFNLAASSPFPVWIGSHL